LRPLLHILSVILLLPNLFFAIAFLLLGHAIAGATLWGFIDRLLTEAVWLVSWGIYAIAAAILALGVAGFFVQTSQVSAGVVALLAASATLVVVVLSSSSLSFGQWLFLLPGFVSLCVSAWLARGN
jgi:hypothetical protein